MSRNLDHCRKNIKIAHNVYMKRYEAEMKKLPKKAPNTYSFDDPIFQFLWSKAIIKFGNGKRICEAMGIAKSTVASWDTGRAPPRHLHVLALAYLTDTKLSL